MISHKIALLQQPAKSRCLVIYFKIPAVEAPEIDMYERGWMKFNSPFPIGIT